MYLRRFSSQIRPRGPFRSRAQGLTTRRGGGPGMRGRSGARRQPAFNDAAFVGLIDSGRGAAIPLFSDLDALVEIEFVASAGRTELWGN